MFISLSGKIGIYCNDSNQNNTLLIDWLISFIILFKYILFFCTFIINMLYL